jgi:hypothetical protein
MENRMKRVLLISLFALASATGARADSTAVWDGRVRAGGVLIDETGNASLMQETYNIYEGFTLSSLYLKGRMNPLTHLLLDLTDINRGDRRGTLDFRRIGSLHVRSTYAENRYVFDPAGVVDARRRNSQSTITYTPSRWLWLSGDYGLQTRTGDRLPFLPGPTGWLGTAYDSKLHRWRGEAQVRAHNGIGGTVAYDGVKQNDALDARRERTGYVASANLVLPHLYFNQVTHVLRGAFGRSELPYSGLGYDLLTGQYTGIVDATRWARLKYRFYASQIDDEATRMRTDNYMHDADATFRWRMAILSAGYGWEALDDDHAVTTSQTVRGALSLRTNDNRVSGRVAYATRNTDDEEATTLLKDTEYDRFDARVEGKPGGGVSLGGRVANRTRKMPDIGSKAEGWTATAYGQWRYEHFSDTSVIAGDLGVDYTFADDKYDNTTGAEHVLTHALTTRISINYHERFDVWNTVTFLDTGEDLDIRKSVVSVGAGYQIGNGFSADASYGAYNYDDYLVFDRYYTANIVWLNLGYSFSTE